MSALTAGTDQWDISTHDGFIAYYDATLRDAYRAAARLTGGNQASAEDVVHDAYLSLMRAARRSDVTEVSVGWIVTAVRNRFIDGVRSSDREERRLQLVATTDTVDAEESSQRSPTATTATNATALLAALSDRERAAMVLRYVDDRPVAEVAELMGTSVRATESLLQRAKRKARSARGAE